MLLDDDDESVGTIIFWLEFDELLSPPDDNSEVLVCAELLWLAAEDKGRSIIIEPEDIGADITV